VPPGGGEEFWNNEKLLSLNMLLVIGGKLEDHGLKPIDASTVQGFNTVDEFFEALPKPPPTDFEAQWNAALLNTPVVDMADEPDDEIDRRDSEDPDDWQGQPSGNPPTS
jgi:hypothetical protein